jgi:hypothetical protein
MLNATAEPPDKKEDGQVIGRDGCSVDTVVLCSAFGRGPRALRVHQKQKLQAARTLGKPLRGPFMTATTQGEMSRNDAGSVLKFSTLLLTILYIFLHFSKLLS